MTFWALQNLLTVSLCVNFIFIQSDTIISDDKLRMIVTNYVTWYEYQFFLEQRNLGPIMDPVFGPRGPKNGPVCGPELYYSL